MTLFMQSQFDVCDKYSKISPKKDIQSTKDEVDKIKEIQEDNLSKNKYLEYKKCEQSEFDEYNKIYNTDITENELIEIERQWAEMMNVSLSQLKEIEDDSDMSESDEECNQPKYPIKKVLNNSFVRKILLRSAAASRNFSLIKFPKSNTGSSIHNKDNKNRAKPSLKKELDTKLVRLPKKVPRFSNTREEKEFSFSTHCSEPPKSNLFPRQQKTKIQSIIKKIEKDLENDIGNGYGDAQWCEVFTKRRIDTKEHDQISAELRDDYLTDKKRQATKSLILTPSWRVIDDYNLPDSHNDNAQYDCSSDDNESVSSDSSNQSDSSLSSTGTWVSSDVVKEYMLPKTNELESGIRAEVRLINLTKMQVQALCKKFILSAPPSNSSRSRCSSVDEAEMKRSNP